MDRIRLIQCGVGGFGEGWLKEYTSRSREFELVALVDVSPKHLTQAGEITGLPAQNQFSSLEAALECIDADAVLTVTPPAVHLDHARTALERGLHVMVEKPIADTIESACEMVRLAEQADRQLVVSQQYRFTPFVQMLRKLCHDNCAGELGHGHLDYYIPMDFTGTFRETMDFPLLLDMTIHHTDLIRCITGRNIRKVYAHSFRPSWSWYRHEPALKMLLELEDGTPFSYSGDWSALGRITSGHGNWRLQCANGSLHMENNRVLVERCERWGKNPSADEPMLPSLEYTNQAATLHLFAQAIRTGQPAEISGRNNLGSFGALIAALKSVREKREVLVEECIPDLPLPKTTRQASLTIVH